MPKIREITPTHLKCNNQHCMRVFADDTGQLVIVGKKLSEPQFSEFRDAIGEDEYAIKIPTEYLTNVFDKS